MGTGPPPVEDDPPAVGSLPMETAAPRPWWLRAGALVRRVRWDKVGLFLASLALFVLAIGLLKEGAAGVAPFVREGLSITNPADGLGFGWLSAYLVLGGSPVAAVALAFFDVGAIDRLTAFAMITGSRLGASFIVLLVGFLYVLRGRDRATSLSMGLLSLTVTGTTHVLGFGLGLYILDRGLWRTLPGGVEGSMASLTDRVVDPALAVLAGALPRGVLFVAGLLVILLSFHLFDRCLPQMTIKESQLGRVSRVVYNPWVMFLLGALVTLISMSVSLSLSILVPLSNRGYVRRENAVPYIMGANVTTFFDTLLAALLLQNPEAVAIVLAQMAAIALVSVVLLLTVFRRYERWMLAAVAWLTDRPRNLTLFVAAIFAVPLVLILL